MTPGVDCRTAAKAAFYLADLAPDLQANAFGKILKAIIVWGRDNQGWSTPAACEFAAAFADAMVAHWPKEGRLQ